MRAADAANEYETTTRLWPGTNQAHCHAEKTTRAGHTKMDASNRAEEDRKRRQFFPQTWAAVAAAPKPPRVQPARGQKRTAEVHGTSQSSIAASLNALSNAMDLGEDARENVLVGSPQALALVTPAASMATATLKNSSHAQWHHQCGSCGCPAESPAHRNYRDEECGRSRWFGRHLTSVRSDNTSRHTLNTGGWTDLRSGGWRRVCQGVPCDKPLSTRDLGAESGALQCKPYSLMVSLRDVSHGEHKPCRADHVVTAMISMYAQHASPAYGDNRNEECEGNPWLGQHLGGDCFPMHVCH